MSLGLVFYQQEVFPAPPVAAAAAAVALWSVEHESLESQRRQMTLIAANKVILNDNKAAEC